jgi:hypothetical protein
MDRVADERDAAALAGRVRQRGGRERWRLGGRRARSEMAREPEGESDQAKRDRDEYRTRYGAWLELVEPEPLSDASLEAEGRSHLLVDRYGALIRP